MPPVGAWLILFQSGGVVIDGAPFLDSLVLDTTGSGGVGVKQMNSSNNALHFERTIHVVLSITNVLQNCCLDDARHKGMGVCDGRTLPTFYTATHSNNIMVSTYGEHDCADIQLRWTDTVQENKFKAKRSAVHDVQTLGPWSRVGKNDIASNCPNAQRTTDFMNSFSRHDQEAQIMNTLVQLESIDADF